MILLPFLLIFQAISGADIRSGPRPGLQNRIQETPDRETANSNQKNAENPDLLNELTLRTNTSDEKTDENLAESFSHKNVSITHEETCP